MSIDRISGIPHNYYADKTQYVSAPAFKASVSYPKKADDSKFWLGVTAAAASVIAGIAICKNYSASKKILEQSKKLKSSENKVKELENKLAEKTKHSGASSDTKNVSSSSSSGSTRKSRSHNSGSNYHDYRQTGHSTAKSEVKETVKAEPKETPAKTEVLETKPQTPKPEVKEAAKTEPKETPTNTEVKPKNVGGMTTKEADDLISELNNKLAEHLEQSGMKLSYRAAVDGVHVSITANENLINNFVKDVVDQCPDLIKEEAKTALENYLRKNTPKINRVIEKPEDAGVIEDMLQEFRQKFESIAGGAEFDKIGEKLEEKYRTKLAEQGRLKYEELNETLDGRISVRVHNKKNKELSKLGEFYHGQELQGIKELAEQAEKMRWFDSYLQDEPLRKILGIADDAEILFTRGFNVSGAPYIKNKTGNIVTYDRRTGIWTEWSEKSIDNFGKHTAPITYTKKADGLIIKRSAKNRFECFIKNLENDREFNTRDNKIYKIIDGKEEDAGRFSQEKRESVNAFFDEVPLELPKHTVYGFPAEVPAEFAAVKNGKRQQTLRDIDAYVATFDNGTFQRVNKTKTFYNADGKCENVNIIYEGMDFDIDVQGRILPKLKADPLVRKVQRSNSRKESQRQMQTQRQVLHA